jgi:predicted RNA-binding Zn-ribbon protein involved in translation (DUF1610 family)
MALPGSIGQRTAGGAVSFRCAACGEIAATVTTVAADCPADMGPPLGLQAQDREGIIVDYFGGTTWKRAETPVYQAVREILSGRAPDPAALRQIDRDLTPFYCPDCGQNYCRADWHPTAGPGGGFHDGSMGRCPHGHKHRIYG